MQETVDDLIEKHGRCNENMTHEDENDQRKSRVESRGWSWNVRVESFATFHLKEKRFAAIETARDNESLET